jgi:hypothetical protein
VMCAKADGAPNKASASKGEKTNFMGKL